MDIKSIIFLVTLLCTLCINSSNAKSENLSRERVENCYVTILYHWKKKPSSIEGIKSWNQIFKSTGVYLNKLSLREEKPIVNATNFQNYITGKFVIWYTVSCPQAQIWSDELVVFLKRDIPKKYLPDTIRILNITTSDKEYKEPWRVR